MAGRTKYNGTNLFLDDSNFSSKYHTNRPTLSTIPKPKHTFFVCLIPTPEALSAVGISSYNILDFIFSVKETDIPSVDIEIDALDQYNRKRLIQTRANYEPISMTMYDDNSSKVQLLLDKYMEYHYASFRSGMSDTVGTRSTSTQQVQFNTSINQHGERHVVDGLHQPGRYGFKPKDTPFFSRATYFKLHSDKKVSSWTCFNPLIKSIVYDPVSYAAESEPSEINVTLEYEVMVPYDRNVSIDIKNNSYNVSSITSPDVALLSSIYSAVHGLTEFYDVTGSLVKNDKGILPKNLLTNVARELFDTQKYPGGIKDALKADNIKNEILDGVKGKASSVLSSWGNFKL